MSWNNTVDDYWSAGLGSSESDEYTVFVSHMIDDLPMIHINSVFNDYWQETFSYELTELQLDELIAILHEAKSRFNHQKDMR
jgi:hypothetical protein